jgi:hypothetical protein
MDEFVVIFRNDNKELDWGRVSAGSLSEAREQGRKFGAVKLLFPLSDLKNILHGRDPQSGRVDADVFEFVHDVSSSMKPLVIRISSSSHIMDAVNTVKGFLDNVGAWYKHHRSKKSGSEYFLVERPDDRLSPEVDVRVSDHDLPYMYDQPDLDVDPDSPARSGSYSVPEALGLLEGFFDGDYVNIIEGEPIASSGHGLMLGSSYIPLSYEMDPDTYCWTATNLPQDLRDKLMVIPAKEDWDHLGFVGVNPEDNNVLMMGDNLPAVRSSCQECEYYLIVDTGGDPVGVIGFNLSPYSGSNAFPKGFWDTLRGEFPLSPGDLFVTEICLYGWKSNSVTLVKDVFSLLNTMLDKYGVVVWSAGNGIPIKPAYDRKIKEWHGYTQENKRTTSYALVKGATFSSYTPLQSGRRQGILSTLVEATPERFNAIKTTQPDVWKMLHTKASDPSVKERFEYFSEKFYPDNTLADLINECRKEGFKVFFSEKNDSIYGFLAFKVSGDLISDVKIFSVASGVGFGRDLFEEFLRSYVQDYTITWIAHKDRETAIRSYKHAVRLYGGTVKEDPQKPSHLIFTIKAGSSLVASGASSRLGRGVLWGSLVASQPSSPTVVPTLSKQFSHDGSQDGLGSSVFTRKDGRKVRGVKSSVKELIESASASPSTCRGYWISPSYDVYDVSGTDHVQFIWDNSELFGVSDVGKDFEYLADGVLFDVCLSGWVKVRVTNCVYIGLGNSKKLPTKLQKVADALVNRVPKSFYIMVRVYNRDGTTGYAKASLSDLLLGDIPSFMFSSYTPLQSGRRRAITESMGLKYKPIFNSKEMLSGGVWISPQGDIFGVPLTHVRAVIEDTSKFGLSMEQVKVIYNKHNEGIGSEGAARDELVSLLISNGWVRIRYYPGEFFHVELSLLNQTYARFLSIWASKVVAKDGNKKSFKVVICETHKGGLESSYVLSELCSVNTLYSRRQSMKDIIESATIKDLLNENDRNPEFTHREDHLAATKAQGDSEITRCYASTVELRTKSEHFQENKTFYRQWVLFKDFVSIAKDKKIKFEDSVDYAINFCDVSIRCSCFTGDTKVSLLDGRELSFDEISKEFGYKPFWVYSVDSNGDFVPAQATFTGEVSRVSGLVEVSLDNGEIIKCTPDHLFMLRDGSWCRADALVSGVSLMPLHRRRFHPYKGVSGKDAYTGTGYFSIKLNFSGRWVNVHRRVMEVLFPDLMWKVRLKAQEKVCVHHRNFNGFDNSPDNLEWMGIKEHLVFHGTCANRGLENFIYVADCIRNCPCLNYVFHYLGGKVFKKNHPELLEAWSKKGVEWNRDPANKKIKSELVKSAHENGLYKEAVAKIRKSQRSRESMNRVSSTFSAYWASPAGLERKKHSNLKNLCRTGSNNVMASQESRQMVTIGKCLSFCFSLLSSNVDLTPENYEYHKSLKRSPIPHWYTVFSSFDDLLFVVEKALAKSINGQYKGFWEEDRQEVLKCAGFNHKVSSVKLLSVQDIPVYCLTVQDHSNFALSAGVIVHNCPSQLYHGYSYMGDQLGYLYGIPREKRFPKKNNPNLKLSTCKHVDMALEHLLKNKENIIKMFGHYYKRLDETPPDTMIAVPSSVVREKKEESLDDFLAGFDEDGNALPAVEGEEPEEEQVEIISATDPSTGAIHVDTKLAEGNLPPEDQVKYAGEEDKPVEEATVESVADDVSEEEVDEIATQIDEAETFSSYTPLQSDGSHAILSSPDMDYISVSGEARAFLDGICKRVQQRIPSSTISPITNLTWRVALGQTVLLEIKLLGDPSVFSYRYLDKYGKVYTGSVDHKSKLLPLVSKVGK